MYGADRGKRQTIREKKFYNFKNQWLHHAGYTYLKLILYLFDLFIYRSYMDTAMKNSY